MVLPGAVHSLKCLRAIREVFKLNIVGRLNDIGYRGYYKLCAIMPL